MYMWSEMDPTQRFLSPLTLTGTEFEEYVAPTYQDTPAVIRGRNTPRFGNSGNITSLLGTRADKSSYITGVVSVSIFILMIFFIWIVVLIVLKCLGKKVGCASGIPPELPKKEVAEASTHAEHNYDDEYDEVRAKKIKCTILWTRIIFILCGIGNIISASIFVHYGINSLQNSIISVDDSLDQADNILYEVDGVLDEFVVAEQNAEQNKLKFQELMNTTDIDRPRYCYGKKDAPFRKLIIGLSESLSNMGTFITSEVLNLQSDLATVKQIIGEIREQLSTTDWMFKIALAIAIIQIIITIILVSGVCLAWMQRYPKPFRCVQSYVILPFFVCMVFLSALFSCISVCLSIVGSDFCFNDPDSKVLGYIEQQNFNSVAFNVIAFYIKGCIKDTLPDVLKNVSFVIGEGMTALEFTHNLISNVTSVDFGLYKKLCGTDAFIVTQILNATDYALHGLLKTADTTRQLLYCGTINPIYVNVAYDAICYNGVTGVSVIFGTQLCIAIFSMIMVTLRVSWQQIEEGL